MFSRQMDRDEYRRMYGMYLESTAWLKKRQMAMDKTNEVCANCIKATWPVVRLAREVHHLTYERLGHEDLDDLIAVCGPCHRELHGKASRNHGNIMAYSS